MKETNRELPGEPNTEKTSTAFNSWMRPSFSQEPTTQPPLPPPPIATGGPQQLDKNQLMNQGSQQQAAQPMSPVKHEDWAQQFLKSQLGTVPQPLKDIPAAAVAAAPHHSIWDDTPAQMREYINKHGPSLAPAAEYLQTNMPALGNGAYTAAAHIADQIGRGTFGPHAQMLLNGSGNLLGAMQYAGITTLQGLHSILGFTGIFANAGANFIRMAASALGPAGMAAALTTYGLNKFKNYRGDASHMQTLKSLLNMDDGSMHARRHNAGIQKFTDEAMQIPESIKNDDVKAYQYINQVRQTAEEHEKVPSLLLRNALHGKYAGVMDFVKKNAESLNNHLGIESGYHQSEIGNHGHLAPTYGGNFNSNSHVDAIVPAITHALNALQNPLEKAIASNNQRAVDRIVSNAKGLAGLFAHYGTRGSVRSHEDVDKVVNRIDWSQFANRSLRGHALVQQLNGSVGLDEDSTPLQNAALSQNYNTAIPAHHLKAGEHAPVTDEELAHQVANRRLLDDKEVGDRMHMRNTAIGRKSVERARMEERTPLRFIDDKRINTKPDDRATSLTGLAGRGIKNTLVGAYDHIAYPIASLVGRGVMGVGGLAVDGVVGTGKLAYHGTKYVAGKGVDAVGYTYDKAKHALGYVPSEEFANKEEEKEERKPEDARQKRRVDSEYIDEEEDDGINSRGKLKGRGTTLQRRAPLNSIPEEDVFDQVARESKQDAAAYARKPIQVDEAGPASSAPESGDEEGLLSRIGSGVGGVINKLTGNDEETQYRKQLEKQNEERLMRNMSGRRDASQVAFETVPEDSSIAKRIATAAKKKVGRTKDAGVGLDDAGIGESQLGLKNELEFQKGVREASPSEYDDFGNRRFKKGITKRVDRLDENPNIPGVGLGDSIADQVKDRNIQGVRAPTSRKSINEPLTAEQLDKSRREGLRAIGMEAQDAEGLDPQTNEEIERDAVRYRKGGQDALEAWKVDGLNGIKEQLKILKADHGFAKEEAEKVHQARMEQLQEEQEVQRAEKHQKHSDYLAKIQEENEEKVKELEGKLADKHAGIDLEMNLVQQKIDDKSKEFDENVRAFDDARTEMQRQHENAIEEIKKNTELTHQEHLEKTAALEEAFKEKEQSLQEQYDKTEAEVQKARAEFEERQQELKDLQDDFGRDHNIKMVELAEKHDKEMEERKKFFERQGEEHTKKLTEEHRLKKEQWAEEHREHLGSTEAEFHKKRLAAMKGHEEELLRKRQDHSAALENLERRNAIEKTRINAEDGYILANKVIRREFEEQIEGSNLAGKENLGEKLILETAERIAEDPASVTRMEQILNRFVSQANDTERDQFEHLNSIFKQARTKKQLAAMARAFQYARLLANKIDQQRFVEDFQQEAGSQATEAKEEAGSQATEAKEEAGSQATEAKEDAGIQAKKAMGVDHLKVDQKVDPYKKPLNKATKAMEETMKQTFQSANKNLRADRGMETRPDISAKEADELALKYFQSTGGETRFIVGRTKELAQTLDPKYELDKALLKFHENAGDKRQFKLRDVTDLYNATKDNVYVPGIMSAGLRENGQRLVDTTKKFAHRIIKEMRENTRDYHARLESDMGKFLSIQDDDLYEYLDGADKKKKLKEEEERKKAEKDAEERKNRAYERRWGGGAGFFKK